MKLKIDMYDTGDFVFDESQHINLRNMLSQIKGKFILSYNDDDFIRELYKDYNITSVKRSNNLGLVSGKNKEFSELIITNSFFILKKFAILDAALNLLKRHYGKEKCGGICMGQLVK